MFRNRRLENFSGLCWSWLIFLFIALSQQPAHAGSLDVLGAAASAGNFGLRVTLGPTCAISDVVVPGPTVNSDQLACNTVTAGNVQVISAGATFTAGNSIILKNGFSVDSGVPFAAIVNPLVDSAFAFVRDDSPSVVTSYNATFTVNLDGLTLIPGDDIGIFNAYAANGDLLFRATVRSGAGMSENRLALFALDDTAGFVREHTADFLLPAGVNRVHIFWQAGGGTGQFLASVNGLPLSGLADLANGSRSIDSVRLGAIDGTVAGSTGFMDFDDFESWRLALLPSEITVEPAGAVGGFNGNNRAFGRSLALDGDTLVVGLPGDDDGPGTNGGAVYVFERIAGVWTQVQKILNPDDVNGGGDNFGHSVDVVVGPGPLDDYLIAGAPFTSTPGATGGPGLARGKAYIFKRSGAGQFTLHAEIDPPVEEFQGHFGHAVGLDLSVPVNSLTGDLFYTAVVSTPDQASAINRIHEGSVHVYQLVGAPATWHGTHTFFGPNNGAEMGESVDIHGGLIIAGSPLFGNNAPGAAFDFGRGNNQPAGDFSWGAGPRLEAGDANFGDIMGDENGVAVDFDFAVGLAGARRHDLTGAGDAGAAYVFPLESGPVGPVRNETQKLTASDPVANAEFGASVALDGSSMVVSAPGADSGLVSGGGAVYIFQHAGTWTQVNKIFASDVDANFSLFGYAVAIDGGTVAVGMPSNPSGMYPQGVVYLYETFPFVFADGFETGDVAAW